ncbi:diguanylate cyclase [Thermodesulfobacterium sp. TA1]|uniref:diguanylate cyclase n=1 Tax=Thermodesulfobacterium sp. TA1 TaxID=2234087 RepID=UPI001232A123|nr:diguanylate cyclase [Thermodesulfobacterium sp. TA1]QER41733.1 diguanylate cyclase [Thermodesulfobacterium sp. TA1]
MKGKVLVVIPVTFLRKVVEDILKNYFEKIDLVSNIKEAIDLLNNPEVPDLIISSYVLEDGDVFDLLNGLEKNPKTKKIPVILLTSEDDPELKEKTLKKGVVEVILKKDLCQKLPKVLRDFAKIIQLKNLEGSILYLEYTNLYINFLTKLFAETKLKIFTVNTVEEALEVFEQNDIDLVITDFILDKGESGLDLIRNIRENQAKGDVPIIVLTGYDNPVRKIELFKAGADDYIVKPPLEEEVLIKVLNHITKKKIIDRLKEELQNLKGLYLIDPLTGLYNRNVVDEFLKKELEKAKRYKYGLGFIMTDLDNFKKINDNFGHLTGDKVLKNFAQIILACIRKTDYAVRYGGEEFLVVMPHANLEQTIAKAEEIREKLQASEVEGIKVTASFGVTNLDRYPEKSLEELIKISDEALYIAKSKGKNRVEFL